MIRFSILTLFPESIRPYTDESVLRRAEEKKLVSFNFVNLRDCTSDTHHKVDDTPYGGGPGMVLKAEPLLKAVSALKLKSKNDKCKILIMSAGGKQFNNMQAAKLAKQYNHFVLICGRYEGIDARVPKMLSAMGHRPLAVSIGPYVLSGGELPAMVIAEAIARHVPGVLGKHESLEEERHGVGVPAYTRPEVLKFKMKNEKVKIFRVPKVLTTGNHAKIEAWRRSKSTE